MSVDRQRIELNDEIRRLAKLIVLHHDEHEQAIANLTPEDLDDNQ